MTWWLYNDIFRDFLSIQWDDDIRRPLMFCDDLARFLHNSDSLIWQIDVTVRYDIWHDSDDSDNMMSNSWLMIWLWAEWGWCDCDDCKDVFDNYDFLVTGCNLYVTTSWVFYIFS